MGVEVAAEGGVSVTAGGGGVKETGEGGVLLYLVEGHEEVSGAFDVVGLEGLEGPGEALGVRAVAGEVFEGTAGAPSLWRLWSPIWGGEGASEKGART